MHSSTTLSLGHFIFMMEESAVGMCHFWQPTLHDSFTA